MRPRHNPSLANRKRKHALELQLDADWQAGAFVMLAAIVSAFLLSLPFLSRARFNPSSELEREPVKKVQTYNEKAKRPEIN